MSKLEQFAMLKRLPVEFLMRLDVEDDGGMIRFGNGAARARFRKIAKTSKGNFRWANDRNPKRAYGYDRIEEMVQQSSALLIVEGESDALSAWFRKRPALGIPGATMAKFIERDDVERFERVVVIREHDELGKPDQGGKVFPYNVAARLHELQYAGVFVADLPTKDLSALHVEYADDADAFYRILDAAIADAKAISAAPTVEQSDKPARVVRLVAANTIEPTETEYIVRPYIPRGEATWLEGVTKTGKTMVALDIIARITTGTPFVNGEQIERGNVAIITCEDDAARTLVPRLIAAGADRTRVSFVQATEGDEERQIAFLADLSAIEERLRAANVSLVFVDGTFGVLGVKDASSYTEAYNAMLPFVGMVRRLNAGALIVRHVRKSAGAALDKGIGSVGYAALARSTLAVAIDREDDARRIFAHAGCNVGPIGPSYAFAIAQATIEGFAYPVARVEWGETVEISADEAVAPSHVDESGARSEAEEFLLAFLDGARAASEMQDEVKKRGLNFRTVQRVAKRMGVTFLRRGFGEGSLWIPPERTVRDTDTHWRRYETPVANVANVARTGEPIPCAFFIGSPGAGALCQRCQQSWERHAAAVAGNSEGVV